MMLGSNGSSQKADFEASDEHRQHLRESTGNNQKKKVSLAKRNINNSASASSKPRAENKHIFINPTTTHAIISSEHLITHVSRMDYWTNDNVIVIDCPDGDSDASFRRNSLIASPNSELAPNH